MLFFCYLVLLQATPFNEQAIAGLFWALFLAAMAASATSMV